MIEIKITIGKGGETVLDVAGVKGPGCKDLTKDLEKALGKAKQTQKKPEYNQVANVATLQKVGAK